MGRRPSKPTIRELKLMIKHIPNNGFTSLSALSTSSGLSFSTVKKCVELIEFVQTHLNDLSLNKLTYLSGLDSDFQKAMELIKFVEKDVPKIQILRTTSGRTTVHLKEQE